MTRSVWIQLYLPRPEPLTAVGYYSRVGADCSDSWLSLPMCYCVGVKYIFRPIIDLKQWLKCFIRTIARMHGNDRSLGMTCNWFVKAVWVTRLGSDMPPLKMLKRQIRCWPVSYGGNNVRTITLVFLSSRPASVRWFKLATQPGSNSNSLNNMIPIKGELYFIYSFWKSYMMYNIKKVDIKYTWNLPASDLTKSSNL